MYAAVPARIVDSQSCFTYSDGCQRGSSNRLELIEWLSLDCTNATGAWHADAEIKIDKKSLVIRDGMKTKAFWDGTITSVHKPLRLKTRNIAGDESIVLLGDVAAPHGHAQ